MVLALFYCRNMMNKMISDSGLTVNEITSALQRIQAVCGCVCQSVIID